MSGSDESPAYHKRLEVELAELEAANPDTIGKAAANLERVITLIGDGRYHKLPCKDETCEWHHSKS